MTAACVLIAIISMADQQGAPPPPPAPKTAGPAETPGPAAAQHNDGSRKDGSIDEPSVDALRAAATRLVMVDPERARSLVNRARRAAWMPEVSVRVQRTLGRNESLDVEGGATDPLPPPVELDTVNDVRYEWRVTWDLGRLVFNSDELRATEEALRMADLRMEVESQVVRLYFERRRLQAEALLDRPGDDASELRRELRIQELAAELDVLSGGAFSRGRAARAAGGRGIR